MAKANANSGNKNNATVKLVALILIGAMVLTFVFAMIATIMAMAQG
ncbi:MAG: hypothetical protein K6A81_07135 [Clostridiales bacterium]|nr:hypothetical protein [Clostridiales bacterium]